MDSSTPSTRATLYHDTLTGLLTVQGWVNELMGGVFSESGGLIGFEAAGISGVNQAFGHAAGDVLLREVATRARQALPPNTVLLRGPGNFFVAWLPGLSGVVVEAFVSHLRQGVCGRPVSLPGGESIPPKIITAVMTVKGGDAVQDAAQTLERLLARQPDYAALPAGGARVRSAQDELNHRLEAVRLFGRDELIEQVLAELKLPALQPATVVVMAPPQAGKTRLLANLMTLLDGQYLPMAEVICRPSDQAIPFTLLVSIIYRLLTAYPTELLLQRVGALVTASPWLGGLFPALRGAGEPPPPPADQDGLRHGLEGLLIELVRFTPHVAVVHSLHLADLESLTALIALQSMSGHGLRLIAGADPDEEGIPAPLRRFMRQHATVLSMPPLTEPQVLDFLREVAPDIAQPAIASHLYQATGGLPLTIEATLRAWVEDGLLSLNGDTWEFFPEKVPASPALGLSATEREMLAKAALAGPRSVTFLASLWHLSEPDARQVVERARALGFVSSDDADPDLVQFADPDEAAGMAQYLTREARVAVHREIAELLETAPVEHTDRFLRELAYHYNAAGFADRAQPYLNIVQPVVYAPMGGGGRAASGLERWDIPPPEPVTTDDVPLLVEVALAIRLAGVKFRLYPPNSPIVTGAVKDAVTSLETLLSRRPSFIIAYDGTNLAFDGQVFVRRDVQVAVKDYQTWMAQGSLRAIGFAPGVHEEELSQFLQAVVLFETSDNGDTLVEKIQELPLTHIKVMGREFQGDMTGGYGGGMPMAFPGMPMAGGAPMGGVFPAAGAAYPNMGSAYPANGGAYPAHGGGTPVGFPFGQAGQSSAESIPLSEFLSPAEIENLAYPSNGSNGSNGITGLRPQNAAQPEASTRELGFDTAALLSNPAAVDAETWSRLPNVIDRVPVNARRVMMANLARWMREQDAQPAASPLPASALPDGVDKLLIERVRSENDFLSLREVAASAEKRLAHLMGQHAWEEMISLLEPMRKRAEVDPAAEVRRQLGGVLDRVGEGTALRGLIDKSVQTQGDLDRARRVVVLLGERALRPLIQALKSANTMQERVRLMQLLREFGDTQQPLLLEELRSPNAWFVYRNLLQVLEEVGTADALPAIAEKLRHDDPRVRAEAVSAAVTIAREQATTYLLLGLQDEDADVRARALSLVGHCRDKRVLEQVLRLLMAQRMGRDEPETVQLTACLALGQFDEEEAVQALLQILHPRLFSPFRRKSDEVRGAAVSVLGKHLDKSGVAEALEQAVRDRSVTVRQTAQRMLQQGGRG